jgi:hypothetical protein
MNQLGEKALDCLRVAAIEGEERWTAYAEICERYSEKAVDATYESLCKRGYMECGVSARTGWLTDKGREMLSNPAPVSPR